MAGDFYYLYSFLFAAFLYRLHLLHSCFLLCALYGIAFQKLRKRRQSLFLI